MSNDSAAPPDRTDPATAARRPALAALADLFVPPVGHLYVGEVRRAILPLLAAYLVPGLLLLGILVRPSLATVLSVAGVATALGIRVFLAVDAYRLARGRTSGYVLRPYNRWFAYVALALLVWIGGEAYKAVLKSYLQAFRIPSRSMMPTLLVGDFLFVDKTARGRQGLHRGDIVVFPFPQDPTKNFVDRVVATGGETIEIRDKRVLVNGVALEEPYATHADPMVKPGGYEPRDNYGPFTVPPGELFVMGDNRDNANDSRYWGTLSERAVRGKALVIYWSWNDSQSSPRWDRVGMLVR